LLEAYSEIDTKLLQLNGNDASFRMSEDVGFIEALNQQQVNTLLYGNVAVDAKTYTGLATRYGTISGAGNAQNIIDAGGTGSVNTSMYLVGWGVLRRSSAPIRRAARPVWCRRTSASTP
jgi:hypothetical protein